MSKEKLKFSYEVKTSGDYTYHEVESEFDFPRVWVEVVSNEEMDPAKHVKLKDIEFEESWNECEGHDSRFDVSVKDGVVKTMHAGFEDKEEEYELYDSWDNGEFKDGQWVYELNIFCG